MSSIYGMFIADICLSLSLIELILRYEDSIMKVLPEEVQLNLYMYSRDKPTERRVCMSDAIPSIPQGSN